MWACSSSTSSWCGTGNRPGCITIGWEKFWCVFLKTFASCPNAEWFRVFRYRRRQEVVSVAKAPQLCQRGVISTPVIPAIWGPDWTTNRTHKKNTNTQQWGAFHTDLPAIYSLAGSIGSKQKPGWWLTVGKNKNRAKSFLMCLFAFRSIRTTDT